MMEIRKAQSEDIPALLQLLTEISRVHHEGRPDLFGVGQKYSAGELEVILRDPQRVVLVAVDGATQQVAGYAICVLELHQRERVLKHVRTLYLDDLCVESQVRGQGTGHLLIEAVKNEAKSLGCYNLTLNVWACNPRAHRFYEQCGMKVQKYCMETIL